jgi:protocatechuate 3,4-dioxygenase beta subunit
MKTIFMLLLTSCTVATQPLLPSSEPITSEHIDVKRVELLMNNGRGCKLTSEIYNNNVPYIYKTNNLRTKIGSLISANGENIILNGVLTDMNCVPVINATVQIWQTDSNGYFAAPQENTYLYDKLNYTKQHELLPSIDVSQADRYFTGSGSTITDNAGRYNFLTIMPAIPIINVRVLHRDFPPFQTQIRFDKGINTWKQINDSNLYIFNITLPYLNKYRK